MVERACTLLSEPLRVTNTYEASDAAMLAWSYPSPEFGNRTKLDYNGGALLQRALFLHSDEKEKPGALLLQAWGLVFGVGMKESIYLPTVTVWASR